MKKFVLIMMFFAMLKGIAYAGFLSGNASPYVEGTGLFAVKLSASSLMTQTPYSSGCLAIKYGLSDNINIYAKSGLGTIDYTTDKGMKLTGNPQSSTFGVEYIFNGSREAQYSALVTEYETVTWAVNKKSNTSMEMMVGLDLVQPIVNSLRTRYRIALNNFNAGDQGDTKLASTGKVSLSTELEYYFTRNIRASFDAGVYFGDPNGLISTFGFGLGYGS